MACQCKLYCVIDDERVRPCRGFNIKLKQRSVTFGGFSYEEIRGMLRYLGYDDSAKDDVSAPEQARERDNAVERLGGALEAVLDEVQDARSLRENTDRRAAAAALQSLAGCQTDP
jgi:hypothetical protein